MITMSDTAGGGPQFDGPWKRFQPADDYEGYPATMDNSPGKTHIVDARTFVNKTTAINPDRSEHTGDIHNVGGAESYCGRTLVGRLVALDGEHGPAYEKGICSNCLRSLKASARESEQDE